MLRPRANALIITILFFALACSSQQGSEGKTDSDKPVDPGTPSDDPASDVNDETSDQPAMVSGAFLTAFGPVKEAPAGLAAEGETVLGLNLFHIDGTTRVFESTAVTAVTYKISNVEKTAKVAADPSGKWHALIVIPVTDKDVMEKPMVRATIDEVATIDISSETTVMYDPEGVSGDTSAKTTTPDGQVVPDFSAEIDARPRPEKSTVPVAVTEHILFVTDRLYQPGIAFATGKSFSSVAEANRHCNQEASAYPETAVFWWKAVMSDNEADAKSRIVISGVVKNRAGDEIAAGADEFWTGKIAADSLRYLNFARADGYKGDHVWTGSGNDGTKSKDTCGSWKSAAAADRAAKGNPGDISKWLDAGHADVSTCDKSGRLYCVSYKTR